MEAEAGVKPRSPNGRAAARGLDPASASNTLSCQRETLHSQQLRSIEKSIDSDHGIYRDLRNVVANYPFESSRGFPDPSRISAMETTRV